MDRHAGLSIAALTLIMQQQDDFLYGEEPRNPPWKRKNSGKNRNQIKAARKQRKQNRKNK